MFLILLNCVFLAAETWTTPAASDEEKDWVHHVLDISDFVFNVLFTIEAGVRMVGLGFWGEFEEVYGPNEYYQDK